MMANVVDIFEYYSTPKLARILLFGYGAFLDDSAKDVLRGIVLYEDDSDEAAMLVKLLCDELMERYKV